MLVENAGQQCHPAFFRSPLPVGVHRFFRSLISERAYRFFRSPFFQAGRGSPLWGTEVEKDAQSFSYLATGFPRPHYYYSSTIHKNIL